ncbi:MAG: Histidine kinase [Bacteroidota bacterium]
MPLNRKHMYWVFQSVGWFVWALNEALLYTNQYGWKWAWVFSSIINILFAVFLTHQYKLISHRYHWQELRFSRLIQYNLLALFIMAALLVGLNIPMDYLFLAENYEVNISPFIVLQIFFNFMKPLAIWQLIYFFFQYSKKSVLMERQNNQLERTILETEGKVLRAQMNPHFVFNALNSIRALITEDPQKAKKGINQLSKLLRSSLLTDRKKTIPLSEELDTIADYLALEKIRYEDRLEWEIRGEEHVKKAQIPPMILQTLVENSIKHGISHSVKGGKIEILMEKTGDKLCIRVINPGHLKTKGDAIGVGMENSRHRIRLLYGETAQLILRPLDKNHVEAALILPYFEE